MFAEVIVDISNSEVDKVFDYFVPPQLDTVTAGYRVTVPFGPREIEGYVMKIKDATDCPKNKIKPILKTLDDYPVIDEHLFLLLEFMVKKYHLRFVDALRLFIPSELRGGRIKELKRQFVYLNKEYADKSAEEFIKPSATSQREIFYYLLENNSADAAFINKEFSASALRNLAARGIVEIKTEEVLRTPLKDVGSILSDKKIVLTPVQTAAAEEIKNSNGIFLLHGITGSGKTEVYFHCITNALSKGQTAVMLVPEISLTPQALKGLRNKFGNKVAILHSGLSAGERFDEWRRLLSGDALVAVGARSAIFAPLKNLGIIIIDEEHDSSYLSETNPRYSTHEVAKERQKLSADCRLVLGSATPSIESYHAARSNEYKLIEMPERINKRALPEIEPVNMCNELYDGNNGVFSRKLESALHECVESGNQAMIFINRRGYSSFVMCRSCGYVAKCAACDVSLVYHSEDSCLKCHYCNSRYAHLDLCPECKSEHIRRGYAGTQQVVGVLEKMFPNKKILRMDNDTTQNKDSHLKILSEFASKKAAVLVGTQMIAKGHDFPDVTLVGIVDADMSLHFSDYRSAERTYQLITQVSGRAGRDNKVGRVVLQTYTPHHYVYKYALQSNYTAFYEKEVNLREVTKYPPFATILRILVSSEKDELASEALKRIFNDISNLQRESPDDFLYMAAMRSPIKKINNRIRMQVLMRLKAGSEELIQTIFSIVDKHTVQKISIF